MLVLVLNKYLTHQLSYGEFSISRSWSLNCIAALILRTGSFLSHRSKVQGKKIFLIFQCSSHTCKIAWYCSFLLLAKKKSSSKINLKFPQGLTVCRQQGRLEATFFFFLLFSHITWSLSLHFCSSPWENQFQLAANAPTQQCCVLALKSTQEEAKSKAAALCQGQTGAGCCFLRRTTVEWHSCSWGNQKKNQTHPVCMGCPVGI